MAIFTDQVADLECSGAALASDGLPRGPRLRKAGPDKHAVLSSSGFVRLGVVVLDTADGGAGTTSSPASAGRSAACIVIVWFHARNTSKRCGRRSRSDDIDTSRHGYCVVLVVAAAEPLGKNELRSSTNERLIGQSSASEKIDDVVHDARTHLRRRCWRRCYHWRRIQVVGW